MKFKITFLFSLAVAALSTLGQTVNGAAQFSDDKNMEVKWYPGHYLTLDTNQPRDAWKEIAGKKGFAGGQRIYTWRQLEPEKGKYDFTAIEKDLEILRGQNQRLILEVWDTTFISNIIPVPDYIVSAEYNGGVARERKTVIRTKRWIPAIMDRYLLLLEALGKRFDNDPYFAGLVHTETAMANKGPGFEDFTGNAFDTQMRRLVAGSRKAFPHTPVILFGNWYPSGGIEALTSLSKYAIEEGVGWGGPDLLPGAKPWGYEIIRANPGKMALGVAAQFASYSGKYSVAQLLDLAKEMKLNFVFWGHFERKKKGGLSFKDDVIPAIESNGNVLAMERPENLNKFNTQ